MRISKKLILGYFLLIVVPFLTFAYLMYIQIYDKLVTQYQLANQQNIEQLASNLDAKLSKVESLYSIYQNNATLLSFLRGEYTNDSDLIYNYLKEIRTAFSFSYLAEPMVEEITIFPKGENRLVTLPGFKNYEDINKNVRIEEVSALGPTSGVWKLTETGLQPSSLVYYHKIFSDSYSKELGMIEIRVSTSIMLEFIDAIKTIHPEGDLLLLQQENKSVVYHSGNLGKKQIEEVQKIVVENQTKYFSFKNGQFFINTTKLPKIGLTVVEVNKKDSIFSIYQKQYVWIVGGIATLVLLTILYYLIVSFMTKRIVLLSRHMKKDGLHFYSGKAGNDEIGYLISNYNTMITRINELVNHVKRVERLKNEANFKMLQAQIHPHFLYNTLETMRMLARGDGNKTLADMAYSLGRLLRYSLSNNSDTTLQEELEHVRSYIGIHQIRMSDLEVEFQIDETAMSLPCPRFILQPLVENSLLHGLAKKRGSKKISIIIRVESACTIIEVEDNGIGIPEKRLAFVQSILSKNSEIENGEEQRTGIGLVNVNERIHAYYLNDSKLWIESNTNDGTSCTLKLYQKESHDVEIDDCG